MRERRLTSQQQDDAAVKCGDGTSPVLVTFDSVDGRLFARKCGCFPCNGEGSPSSRSDKVPTWHLLACVHHGTAGTQ